MVVCSHELIQKLTLDRSVVLTLALAALLIDCRSEPAPSTGRWPSPAATPDFDAEIA